MSKIEDAGISWRKSTYSNPSGNCVELADLPDGRIAVRNSRFPAGPALVFTRPQLRAFLKATSEGRFAG